MWIALKSTEMLAQGIPFRRVGTEGPIRSIDINNADCSYIGDIDATLDASTFI
jgi:hypothetical protein